LNEERITLKYHPVDLKKRVKTYPFSERINKVVRKNIEGPR
jgi:hypothetical protein